MRSKSFQWFVVGTTAMLAGCAVSASRTAEKAQSSLVGITEEQLYTCAGVPHREAATPDVHVLTYFASGGATMNKNATRIRSRYCEATFVLRNGIVQSVRYTGNTGRLLTKYRECEPIIRNCVP